MVEKIMVVGAGGHCRVLLSILSYFPQFTVDGIADRDKNNINEVVADSLIKYSMDEFENIYNSGIKNCVIAIGDNQERKALYDELKRIGFVIPTLIHPTAIVEKNAIIGTGNVICMAVKIGTLVSVGENSVIYTGSIIDHESEIGKNVFIAPGCNIAGRVNIGENSFIGIGSSIKEKVKIGKSAVIGAGSVVINDIADGATVAGVPAKNIR